MKISREQLNYNPFKMKFTSGFLLILSLFNLRITLGAVGDYCQKGSDCGSATTQCCAYNTTLKTSGPLEFTCRQLSTTGYTCLTSAQTYSNLCTGFTVICYNNTLKYAVCGSVDQYNARAATSGTAGITCSGVPVTNTTTNSTTNSTTNNTSTVNQTAINAAIAAMTCTECHKANNKWCYLGPNQGICCSGTSCNSYNKTLAFCSDLAKSYSMKFSYCPYDANSCLASDSLLPASVMQAQQFMFTPASQFNLGKYCYWIIRPPSEFTADLVLKIKIDKLYGTECYMNFGGSLATAGSEKTCSESQTYSFTYQELGEASDVYLVALPASNSAHIKFTYWAEPRFSLTYIILIMVGGIVFLTLLVMLIFVCVIDCSLTQALKETVDSVRKTFTDTIEEMEPGKIKDQFDSSMLNLTQNAQSPMGHTHAGDDPKY